MKIKISSNTSNTFLLNQIIYYISVYMIYSPLTALSLPHIKKKPLNRLRLLFFGIDFKLNDIVKPPQVLMRPPRHLFFISLLYNLLPGPNFVDQTS